MSQEPRDLVVALNMYILGVISQIAKENVEDAMLRFGIDRATAVELSNLNLAEIFEIARSPTFLFKIDQDSIKDALKDRNLGTGYKKMHNSIVGIAALLKNNDGDRDA